MPKIEKDCHAYVINAEKRKNAEAMNAKDANLKKGPPQKSYGQNKPYNNPNQNRPQGYNNPHSNYKHYQKHPSGHTHSHGHGHDNPTHGYQSSDKGQKASSQYNLSSNLTNLFKNETTSKTTQNPPKENKNDGNKIKDQNKQSSHIGTGDKAKKLDITNPDIFTKNVESLNHKRHTNHEIDSFEQITKKRHTDPIGQNN